MGGASSRDRASEIQSRDARSARHGACGSEPGGGGGWGWQRGDLVGTRRMRTVGTSAFRLRMAHALPRPGASALGWERRSQPGARHPALAHSHAWLRCIVQAVLGPLYFGRISLVFRPHVLVLEVQVEGELPDLLQDAQLDQVLQPLPLECRPHLQPEHIQLGIA